MHLFIFESYLVITANLTPAIAFHSFGVVLQCLCRGRAGPWRAVLKGSQAKRMFFSLPAQAALQGRSEKHKWTQSVQNYFMICLLQRLSLGSLCCCCTLSANLCIPGIQSSTSIKDQCFLTYGQCCVPVWYHHLPDDTSRHHPWSNQSLSHPA